MCRRGLEKLVTDAPSKCHHFYWYACLWPVKNGADESISISIIDLVQEIVYNAKRKRLVEKIPLGVLQEKILT